MKPEIILLFALCIPFSLAAKLRTQPIAYEFAGMDYESILLYEDTVETTLPGVLIVPNWMGPTEASLEKAKDVAKRGYVVMMVDMYGIDIRPQNVEQASQAAQTVRSDRTMMRQRINHALQIFKAQADYAPLNSEKIAAIGFCFGGGTVLELARSGMDIAGVVSFHGNLDTPDPEDANNIACKVLVLHGADDPYVPAEQVADFEAEMRAADVDWQLNIYGGAVHSFTNPQADQPGKSAYDPTVSRRSFQAMDLFFAEIFAQ